MSACSAPRGESADVDAGVARQAVSILSVSAQVQQHVTTADEATHAFEVTIDLAARGEPWLGGALGRHEEGLELSNHAFVARGRAGEGVVVGDIDIKAERDARDGLVFGLGHIARFDTRLRPVGAAPVLGVGVDTRVAWHDVWPSTDVLLVAGARFAEWAMLLRNPQAPRSFAFEATLPTSIKDVQRSADGDLLFVDANHEPALRVRAPFVVDAAGTKRAARMLWDSGRLVVDFDPAGLAYPLVLDPTLDVPTWTQMPTVHPSLPEGAVVVSSSTRLWSINGSYGSTLGAGESYDFSSSLIDPWGAIPAGGPTNRRYGAGAIDPNGQIVVFGGWIPTGAVNNWSWFNGTTWSATATALRSDGTALPGLVGPFMAPYTTSGLGTLTGVALWGGNNDSLVASSEVLVRPSGATSWTKVTPSVPSGAPEARSHGMFVTNGNTIYMAGGYGYLPSAHRFADTWMLQAAVDFSSNLTMLWVPVCGAAGKPACPFGQRHAMASAFDDARKRAIMFGGQDASGGELGEVWELSASTNTWTAICGTSTTSPCATGLTARHGGGMTCRKSAGKTTCYLVGGVGAGNAMLKETWLYSVRGNSCTSAADCDTGSCVDGACCESTACPTCQSCAIAGSEGKCANVPNGTEHTTCNGTSVCDGAGTCVLKQGQACTAGSQCFSGFCSDGYCCNTACGGACDACAVAKGASANGTCTLRAAGAAGEPSCAPNVCSGSSAACPGACTKDADCTSTSYCAADGTCKARKTLGATCNPAVDCAGGSCHVCASGYCTDGVCCDSLCDGLCQACSKARKGTTAEDGKCGYAAAGLPDRAGRCPDSGTSATTGCKTDGTCSGSGSCRIYSNTTSCGSGGATCVGNSASGTFCDGLGTCVASGATKDCGTYKCATGVGCPASCTTDADCTSAAYCSPEKNCVPKLALGMACKEGRECDSAVCADGNCCERPCGDVCEACNIKGVEGKCAPVIGAPVHGSCPAADPAAPCKAPSCDGTVRTSCIGRPGADTICAAASCEGGVAKPESRCDGKGTCVSSGASNNCAPFTCAKDGCRDSCTSDAECVAPATCDLATGRCVESGKCDVDGHTPLAADGTKGTDCAPFRCEPNGTCKQTCATSGDCVAPNICDPSNSKCVPAPDVPAQDDPGGCSTSRGRRSDAGVAVALVALAIASHRRRTAAR